MTTVDLWTLVKDHAGLNQAAKDLILMQGYENQKAIAEPLSRAWQARIGGTHGVPHSLTDRARLQQHRLTYLIKLT
jgi:hypothetical protein